MYLQKEKKRAREQSKHEASADGLGLEPPRKIPRVRVFMSPFLRQLDMQDSCVC